MEIVAIFWHYSSSACVLHRTEGLRRGSRGARECTAMVRTVAQSRLILASSSPRRRQLLVEAGVDFEVIDPRIPEPQDGVEGLSPGRRAEAAAYFKARAVAERHPDAIVLAGDTVVSVADKILGKPADSEEARRMLRTLSGTRHEVITGVALLGPGGQRLIASAVTRVTMREITGDEIDAYVDSGEWMGKAGAYAIQETADRYIEAVEGSFTNVVGMPMELVLRMLRELREHPDAHKGI